MNINVKDFVLLHNQYAKEEKEHWGIIVSKQLPIGETLRRVLSVLQKNSQTSLKNRILFLSGERKQLVVFPKLLLKNTSYPGLKSEVMMSLVSNGTGFVSCRAICDNVKSRYKPKKHGSSVFHLDHLRDSMPHIAQVTLR